MEKEFLRVQAKLMGDAQDARQSRVGRINTARAKAENADNDWQCELERVFGSNAGDARYTEAGQSTPRLAYLAKRKRMADSRLWEILNEKRAWERA